MILLYKIYNKYINKYEICLTLNLLRITRYLRYVHI